MIKEKIKNVSDQVNAEIEDVPALVDAPSIAPEEFVRANLQDILTQTNDTTDETLSDLKNVKDEIKLNFPEKTGIKSIDEKNLEDYYDVLQQIRLDLFIDEDSENPDDFNIPDLIDESDFPNIVDIPTLADVPDELNISDLVDLETSNDIDKPSLEDIPLEKPKNLLDQIHLSYPEQTGIASIDEKN